MNTNKTDVLIMVGSLQGMLAGDGFENRTARHTLLLLMTVYTLSWLKNRREAFAFRKAQLASVHPIAGR